MHKKVVKRYNLTRILLPIYAALKIVFDNKTIFSKAIHMRILLIHWEIDNLKEELGKKYAE